jgi:hypothetical protein
MSQTVSFSFSASLFCEPVTRLFRTVMPQHLSPTELGTMNPSPLEVLLWSRYRRCIPFTPLSALATLARATLALASSNLLDPLDPKTRVASLS